MNFKNWIKNKKIGVLYGGISAEREISILSGRAVIKGLKSAGVNVVGIDVDRNSAEKIKKSKIDFAFITLHGPWGEDGTIQGMLEIMGIPYSGCDVLSSALSMNKIYSKKIFDSCRIPTAAWQVLKKNEKVNFTALEKKLPLVVKPACQGSAIGVYVVRTKSMLKESICSAFKYGEEIIIEKFIEGKEITVGILGKEALPVVEIVPKGDFYDFKSKYEPGQSAHIIPARLSKDITRAVQRLALKVFDVLGCRVVGRVDMIVDKNNRPWVLEINTLPGMTNTSLLPDEARAVGMSFSELVLKIIEYSIKGV